MFAIPRFRLFGARPLAAVLYLAAGLLAQAQDHAPIDVYAAPRAASELLLDGKLNDDAWAAAPVASGFTLFGQEQPAEVQTSFQVLYDDRYLYFGIRCDEPELSRLVPFRHPRDTLDIFKGEAIEIFVDPGHTHRHYFQFGVTVAESLFDGEGRNVFWDSETIVKGHMEGEGWSVEVAIPWRALALIPQPGRVLGFNVNRDRNLTGSTTYMTWSRVRDGFHDPARFAHLVLSGTADMIAGMGEALRFGNRTGPIVLHGAAGRSATDFRALAATRLAVLQRLLDDLAAEQQRAGNAVLATELAGRINDYRAAFADLERAAAVCDDSIRWSRLSVAAQKWESRAHDGLWEARLAALLHTL